MDIYEPVTPAAPGLYVSILLSIKYYSISTTCSGDTYFMFGSRIH